MESKRNNRSESSGNVCLTMHQPWASLLVYGIKRVEGRSWPTDHRGRLWIHAASKQPTTEEISEVEEQYRFIYNNVEGVEVEFPQSYPTSCLLGCVDVVGCASQNVIQQSPDVSEGIKMESGSEYGFLCENPQSLILPFQLSGQHKLWKLDSSSLRSAKQVATE
mmetsp:Transcript_9849/g.12855  ORF Transcript_9849/g.12855 Transcript_9849/m.12855 type:complete len:164 (+) Transcript_9849:168-659(+)